MHAILSLSLPLSLNLPLLKTKDSPFALGSLEERLKALHAAHSQGLVPVATVKAVSKAYREAAMAPFRRLQREEEAHKRKVGEAAPQTHTLSFT